MRLRQSIEEAIRSNEDPAKAAIVICRLLEDEIGLSGNGWFDDDQELINILFPAKVEE